MSARTLEGTGLAEILRAEAAREAKAFAETAGRPPGLRVILVGDDAGSAVYVRAKEKAALAAGLLAETVRLPSSASESELLDQVASANRAGGIDGLLVQMPLPAAIPPRKILDAIDPSKDVDGFHPVNVGLLQQGRPRFVPCTPAGILELLRREELPIEGRHAVIVGRSEIVGKPMAALLLGANATVTIAHSKTRDLAAVCRTADILVVAMGRARFVTRDFIRPGAVVIDVGINRLETGLCGDVDFEAAREIASAITPVPKGIGPLTVAMLLKNTVKAANLTSLAPSPAGEGVAESRG